MTTALVIAVAVTWSGTATAGATTVDSCTIVASPAPGMVTTCPGADFTDPLPGPVDLSGADLHGSTFAPGRVTGLSGADLSRADLTQAHLVGVDLSGTDLSGADLTGADLSDADLRHAILTGARLDRATLTRTDLSDADLDRGIDRQRRLVEERSVRTERRATRSAAPA